MILKTMQNMKAQKNMYVKIYVIKHAKNVLAKKKICVPNVLQKMMINYTKIEIMMKLKKSVFVIHIILINRKKGLKK